MQIIIVEELGINPYSLYKAKVHSEGHGFEFVQITDEGSVRLRTSKPRARNIRTSKAAGKNLPLTQLDRHEIDAAACLKMALEMTARTREILNRKELWLCLTKRGATAPIPDTFQLHFKDIRNEISKRNAVFETATLKKVRTSKAILIYLQSNGDSLKTAAYLGNHVKTTLARYVPPYLSELVYRIKIRSFQKILLFMSVANDDAPHQSLALESQAFERQLKQAFANPDMGGPLYDLLVTPPQTKSDPSIKYFCVSERNLALAIRYVRDGSRSSLKEDCKTVLAKIAEGPIMMKQLLRSAQLAVENEG
jgi:hypothetical protein